MPITHRSYKANALIGLQVNSPLTAANRFINRQQPGCYRQLPLLLQSTLRNVSFSSWKCDLFATHCPSVALFRTVVSLCSVMAGSRTPTSQRKLIRVIRLKFRNARSQIILSHRVLCLKSGGTLILPKLFCPSLIS